MSSASPARSKLACGAYDSLGALSLTAHLIEESQKAAINSKNKSEVTINIVRLRRIRDEEKLIILMVALHWQDQQEMLDYAKHHSLNVPVRVDNTDIVNSWKDYGFPTDYDLGTEHRVVSRDIGHSTRLNLWWRSWL